VAEGSDEHIVINKVIRSALRTDTVTLFPNASCVRDYLYLADAVAAFLAAGKQVPSAFARYVVGSGEAVTIEQAWQLMAKVIKDLTQRDITILTDEKRELDSAEYRHFVADSKLFTAATGWHAATPLAMGIYATAEWLLNKQGKTGMMQSYATSRKKESR
jgi:nucleoside-diphosphate-sugar epimerase